MVVPLVRLGLIFGMGLLAAACSTGVDFVLPPVGSIQLDHTTPADVIAKLGQPTQRTTSTTASSQPSATAPTANVFMAAPIPGNYEHFSYFGGDEMVINANALVAEVTRHGLRRTRSFNCTFYNGKLISYLGSSSYDPDRTDFDDSKISQLVRGQTTGDDVLKLFGQPTGGAIYPAISSAEGEALYYLYIEDNVDSGAHVKLLQIFIDKSGVVREYRSLITTLPRGYSPGQSSVPVMIPSGRH
jgi:hypothetical protein